MDIFDFFNQKMIGDHKKRIVKKEFEQDFEFSEDQELLSDPKKGRNLFLLYILISVFMIILVVKVWSMQIVQGAYFRDLSEGNRIKTQIQPAPRGVVYDKNGKLLVNNSPSFVLELTAQDLPKNKSAKNKIFVNISNLTGIPIQELAQKASKFKAEPQILLENIEREKALVLIEKMVNTPGFSIEQIPTRKYTAGVAFSNIFGYVSKIGQEEYDKLKNQGYTSTELVGKTGLEQYYQDYLRGQNGKKQVEVDASGKVSRILAQQDSVQGDNLYLTLDSDLQQKMYDVLSASIASSKAPGGAAVAINPQNGGILGLVSIPSYDNNIFTSSNQQELAIEYQKLISDPKNPLFDRAISGTYPPGSTIKMLVASAGLQENVITQNTTIFAPGEITITNQYDPSVVYRYPDWKPGGQGRISVENAIAQSCDVFFYEVGGGYQNLKGLGIDRLYEYFKKFGLGNQTGIDLPSEAKGLAPNPKWKQKAKGEGWFVGDTYHASIGQGDVLVTPLQLANYVATIANGGTLYTPHLLLKIQDSKGKIVKQIDKEIKTEHVVDQQNVDIARAGMRLAVTSGTARVLADLPVPAAGKTGTAQFDNNAQAHSWFAAFAPFDNPQIAIVVLVEGGGEGHLVAAPATNEILKYYFSR